VSRAAAGKRAAGGLVDLQELSDDALADYAGAAVFGRGRAYWEEGRCTLLRDGGSSTSWIVRGSAPYQVELYFENPGLHVDCGCPHAREGAFCKHIVAAALAWRAQLSGEQASAPSPARATRKDGKAGAAARQDALRQFVQGRPAAELAERLWDWAARDRDLMADLKAWQAQASIANGPGAWKEALTELLKKTRDFYDWRESARYAQRAAKALPLLRALVVSDTADALEACAFALRKLFKVAAQADDSGGSIGDAMHSVHEVILQALRAAPPQGKAAERWLASWLRLQDEDPWGLWDDEAMLNAAGAQVQRLYSARVADDWARWLQDHAGGKTQERASQAASSPHAPSDTQRHRLRTRYLNDLRRRGDAPALLEALRSDLASAHEFLQLAQVLEAQGRLREAVQQLEAAHKRFGADWRLEEALLRAYERDGCVEEVLAIRRAQLERRPAEASGYTGVLAAAQAAGRDAAAYRAELHAWAEQDEKRQSSSPGTRNATVRVRWLVHEGRHEEALVLAQSRGTSVSAAVLLELARGLRESRTAESALLFERVLHAQMQRAQSPYREELALVREMLASMNPAQAREALARLHAEYRAKRKFIAGLPAPDGD
jgi:uncharacterized Zn finger protein